MRNRFRIEIYDENKLNDLTLYSEQGIDKEYLTELLINQETVNKYKPKQLTKVELGLI
jgi:hypothetical protein